MQTQSQSMLIKTAHSHTMAFHPHPPARQTERLRDRERDGEREKGTKTDNLVGNVLLYFVSSDFEMRLGETQVNEEK